jgi:SepF-like predicted cell division protein (DUF552 family)
MADIMADIKSDKIRLVFHCKKCYYNTSDKRDYAKHIITAKHKRLTNSDKKSDTSEKEFKCDCGKSYMQRQSLFKHKKKCTYIEEEEEDEDEEDETVTVKKEEAPDYKDLLIEAMKTIQRKDDLVSEAMTQLQKKDDIVTEMRKENNVLVTKIKEMLPSLGSNNSITNTNSNNTTNNTFNLQFFLNETCKDALNLTDFINSLQLQLKDLEYTANNGHIKGITNIFQTALSNMEENKRPMHCTDLKREIMYIKENDEWNKDDEKAKMKGTINQITNKNIGNIEEWLEKYPGHINPNSPDFDKFVKMTSNCMGTGNEADDDKIVRNILREVTIDKNKY